MKTTLVALFVKASLALAAWIVLAFFAALLIGSFIRAGRKYQ